MSKPDTIKAAVVTLFQGMRAPTYTCPPHAVYRTWGVWDDRMLNPGLSGDPNVPVVVYGVRSEGKRHMEAGSSGFTRSTMELLVLVARQVIDGIDDPAEAKAPIQDTIAEALEQDALKALLNDPTLGGVVDNVMDPAEGIQSENVHVLDGEGRPAWIVRELRMTVTYSYGASEL